MGLIAKLKFVFACSGFFRIMRGSFLCVANEAKSCMQSLRLAGNSIV